VGEGLPALALRLLAVLGLRERSEHLGDDLDVAGDLHLALVLQLADVSLEPHALPVVVARPVGRRKAAARPVRQHSLLAHTTTTKFYYIMPNRSHSLADYPAPLSAAPTCRIGVDRG
jgi:hypothetical protein